MLDDEIRHELERLNREHQWLKHASAKYPDLCVFEYGSKKLYCSPSVNTEVDEWASTDLIDEGLYHDVTMEANHAITCFKNEDGGRVHSWPPIFVVGKIQRSGPGSFKHVLYEHWRRQLDDAGIAADLVDAIEHAQAERAIEPEPRQWVNGERNYCVYTAEDENGETVGVFRMHERIQLDVSQMIMTRANALGIDFCNHDGGFTINDAHQLQAFVDDTVDFLRDRAAESKQSREEDRNAA